MLEYLSEPNFLKSTLRYSGQQTEHVEGPIPPHTKRLVAEVMVMDEEGEDVVTLARMIEQDSQDGCEVHCVSNKWVAQGWQNGSTSFAATRTLSHP